MCQTFKEALYKLVYRDREILKSTLLRISEAIDCLKRTHDPKQVKDIIKKSIFHNDLEEKDCESPQSMMAFLREKDTEFRSVYKESCYEVPENVKDNILNLLKGVHPTKFFDRDFQLILANPEYGGLESEIIINLYNLYCIMRDAGKPGAINDIIDQFDVKHVMVLSWYWYWADVFDSLRLCPLPGSMVRDIERTMKEKRYKIYPGIQELDDNAYTVYYTICCGKIRGRLGHRIGKKELRYDQTLRCLVCDRNKGPPKGSTDPSEGSHDPDEWKNRAEKSCRLFFYVSCHRQVPLRINMRGKMLIVGNRKDKEVTKYSFCPKCAGLHKVSTECFRTGEYECEDCVAKNPLIIQRYSCWHCGVPLYCKEKKTDDGSDIKLQEPQHVLELYDQADPDDPMGSFKRVYFCAKHYRLAYRDSKRCDMNALRSRISQKNIKSLIKY